jgi:hypothetical protein
MGQRALSLISTRRLILKGARRVVADFVAQSSGVRLLGVLDEVTPAADGFSEDS